MITKEQVVCENMWMNCHLKAIDAKKLYEEELTKSTSDKVVNEIVDGILEKIQSVISDGEVCVDCYVAKTKVIDKLRRLGYIISESGGGSFIHINWKDV